MIRIYTYIRTHKFETYSIAFLLMLLPPLPMYNAAMQGNTPVIMIMLGLFILGNLLVLIVK